MFSIVVPCYNCIERIGETTDSLLAALSYAQTEQGESIAAPEETRQSLQSSIAELVFVDDGSPDGVGEWLDTFAAEHPQLPINVLHQQNGGLVNAWKAGVRAAKGDYIVFCDAEDVVSESIFHNLQTAILCGTTPFATFEEAKNLAPGCPDMILYGCKILYADGREILQDNLLAGGIYDREAIEKEVLPYWFSTGGLESGIALKSRWTKAFRREFLCSLLDEIPEDITMGEDDVTCFAAVLQAKSLLCLKDSYLYTYVRSGDSMVGSYDPYCAEKIDHMMQELMKLAETHGYSYDAQLMEECLSTSLLYMKKEISRNPEGFKSVRNHLAAWRKRESFQKAQSYFSFQDYGLKAGIFAELILHGCYGLAYVLTKLLKGTGI